MSDGARRKYLPAEGYRFLTLAFLRARGEPGASKGEIAWETRANHYMATRVLRELHDEGLIRITGTPDDGFLIGLTHDGHAFLDAHRAYLRRAHRVLIDAHYRFGRRPAWL